MRNILGMLGAILTLILTGCACQSCQQPSSPAVNPIVVSKSDHPMDDTAITTKVKTAFVNEKLFGDRSMAPMSINVETINGVVYLRGTADNKQQIRNAIKIAKSVSGVKRVSSTVMVVK